MKTTSRFLPSLALAITLALPLIPAHSQEAAAYRKFSLRTGQGFSAAVLSKSGTSVTFKLPTGKSQTVRISDLSEPDQQFVNKWTKFKDMLLNNTGFAKTTVRDLLEMRGYQSFEFDIRGNHIFVEGEVNGKKVVLMVDTGAHSTVLHDESAKAAGVQMGEYDQKIRGIGGEIPACVAVPASVKLGDSEINNWKMLAANLFKDQQEKDHDGILGADFLRSMDAVISYREGRMFLKPDKLATVKDNGAKPKSGATPSGKVEVRAEFRRWTKADGKNFVAALDDKNEKEAVFRFQTGQKAPLPLEQLSEADRDIVQKWDKLRDDLAANPEFATLTVKELLELRGYQSFEYRLDGNHILVQGSVGTTKATFMIDTGAFSGILHIGFSKKAGLEMGPMDQKIYGIGGEAPAAITKVPRMQMGEAVIENRELLSADLFKDAGGFGGNHDALFGADFLRQLDAVINYKEGRMFLKPDNSDKPAAPIPAPKTK